MCVRVCMHSNYYYCYLSFMYFLNPYADISIWGKETRSPKAPMWISLPIISRACAFMRSTEVTISRLRSFALQQHRWCPCALSAPENVYTDMNLGIFMIYHDLS